MPLVQVCISAVLVFKAVKASTVAWHCSRFGLKTMPDYENFKIKEKALNLCFESVPIQWTWFGQCRINNSSQKLNVKFMIFGKKSLNTFFHQ